MSGSTVLQTFKILKFLLLNLWVFQYNIQFETKNYFITVLTKVLSKSL